MAARRRASMDGAARRLRGARPRSPAQTTSHLSRVLVATRVSCEPAEAFARFTSEIGDWWQPHGLFQFSEGRSGTLAFEGGQGGRLIETYEDGTVFVVGVISTWAPPKQLVLSWRQASFSPDQCTELHVTFEPVDFGQTCVPLSITDGTPFRPTTRLDMGFPLATFQLRFAEWWRTLLASAFPAADDG